MTVLLNGEPFETPFEYPAELLEGLPVEATEIYPEELANTPFMQKVLNAHEERKASVESIVDSWGEEAKNSNTESEQ